MKVVITGGSGLIGQAVVRALPRSTSATILDIRPPAFRGTAKVLRADVTAARGRLPCFRGADVVIHLAATLGVDRTEKNPVRTLQENIGGSVSVLEACRRYDVPKVLLASSSEAYGEAVRLPMRESDPMAPISVYGVSKLAEEEYAKAYSRQYGVGYVALRYFNVYGPEQTLDFVIPRFVKAALDGKPLLIYGGGRQIRSYCYADDAARFTLALASSAKARDLAVNVGDDTEPVSVRELARRVLAMTGSRSRLVERTLASVGRKDREVINRSPDLTRLRSLVRGGATIGLDDGLRIMARIYRERGPPAPRHELKGFRPVGR